MKIVPQELLGRGACTRCGSGAAALLLVFWMLACGSEPGDSTRSAAAPSSTLSPPGFELVDATEDFGLDLFQSTGTEGSYPMPAIMGGGAAVLDADGDGDLDLFVVGSRPGLEGLGHRFFRQGMDGRFGDETASSGAGASASADSWGMGAAVGDIDNDGDLDLFVSHLGADLLLRNENPRSDGPRSDGSASSVQRFTDVTTASGLGDPGWGASAIFCDYDRDGWLDLFVARYVRWDPKKACTIEGGRLDYCGPAQFPGWSDLLYRNRGDGRFENVSQKSGIAAFEDRGLGVVCADLDDDGWMDFYVANDSDPNHLWINRGDGTFSEEGMLSGAAFNRFGVGEAGMGVVAGDSDGDGDLDLFVSHLIEESNTLYQNRGVDGFEDLTSTVGIGPPSVPYTGFGTAFLDLDLDGDLDLVVVDGAVKRRPAPLSGRSDWFWNDYGEPNLIFLNRGDGGFEDRSRDLPAFSAPIEISRALVPADLDRDGDVDLVVTQIEGPLRVYRNEVEGNGGWLEVRAIDPALRRDAVGARVTIIADGRRWVRQAASFGGYLTGAPPSIHVGLGGVAQVDGFEVRWPDGSSERFAGRQANQVVELVKGKGDSF